MLLGPEFGPLNAKGAEMVESIRERCFRVRTLRVGGSGGGRPVFCSSITMKLLVVA